MAKYGLLFNLDRCVGCRAHEAVCLVQGNKVIRVPILAVARTTAEGNQVMQYLPFVQAKCRLSKPCAVRIGKGLAPSCVLACPARAMQFGEIGQLAKYIEEKGIPHTHLVPF